MTASPMNFSTVPPWRSRTSSHLLEIPRHDVAERLRIEPLAERRRAGDVGEEDGDGLADLPGSSGSQRLATAAAEAEAVRVLLTAARAGEQAQSVRRR